MNKLTSYTIEKIEADKQVITFKAEFSNPEWNKTKRMFYGETSHDEIQKVDMGKHFRNIAVNIKHPLMDVKNPEDVKAKIEEWAAAYIRGKEQEQGQLEAQQPSKEVEELIGKQIKK